MKAFKTALAQDSRVDAVSLGINPITFDGKAGIVKETPGQKTDRLVFFARIDDNYINLLKINLRAGKNFDATISSEKRSEVIVNESFVKWMGWAPDNAVGRLVKSSGGDTPAQRVIGVVADYHFASLHNRIEPLLLYYQVDNPPNVLVRVKPAQVAAVRSIWASLIPTHPFEADFLDTSFNQQYQREQKAKTLLSWFTGLIIFIACMGLFGLAAFTAEQRTKEIGIRKVLGASVTSLVALLSKDFMKLVVIAIVIASPLAWYAMHRWLQDFAYKIEIEWWLFVLAGVLAVGIALLTVSFQSIKAALMNPVNSLRSE